MPFCPIDVITGFIQLQGPIPQTILDSNKQNGSHPLQLNVGTRSTSPSISGKLINDTGNSCSFTTNTVEKYGLVDIQICELLHKGYILPGMNGTPTAELILSFSGPNNVIILMCLPLFNTGRSENDAYLNQVIDSEPQTTSIITFDSMFANQPSLGYTNCYEWVDKNNTVQSSQLHIFVFPKGIHLTNSNYSKLMKIIGTLPVYGLSPAIRNNFATVSASTIVNGSKQLSSTSTDGKLPIVQIASCDGEFTTKFMYYVQGPTTNLSNRSKKVASSGSNSGSNSASQYKCVPFSKYVTQHPNDPALKEVIGSYANTVSANSNPNSTLDPKNILGMESIIGALIAVLVIAIPAYTVYKMSSD